MAKIPEVLNKVATGLATIGGLVFIPVQVAQLLGSWKVGAATAIGLTATLGVGAARLLLPSQVYRSFGLRKPPTRVVLVRSDDQMHIRSDFSALMEAEQVLVFLETPTPDDLVDIIDVLPRHTIGDSAYSSADSDIIDVVQRSPSELAVRWRPKGVLRKNVPYTHLTQYRTPSIYGDDVFFQGLYVDRETGTRRWRITTEVAVERALAFVMPRTRPRVSEPYVYWRALSTVERGCEQPVLSADGHSLEWTLINPTVGRTYVLFGVYEGMAQRVADQAKTYGVLPQLARMLKRGRSGPTPLAPPG